MIYKKEPKTKHNHSRERRVDEILFLIHNKSMKEIAEIIYELEKYRNLIAIPKVEKKTIRDSDINYDFHEGRGEDNELL